MKSLFLLFISLSFVACLPVDLSNEESYFSRPVKELPHVESSVSHNTAIDIHPKKVHVVVDTKPMILKPADTNESFVGPPSDNLLSTEGRHLLRSRARSPAPAPKPVVKPAPAPAHKPIVKPAPAPKPIVKPAPAPKPIVKSAPAPKPIVKSAPAPAPKIVVKTRGKHHRNTNVKAINDVRKQTVSVAETKALATREKQFNAWIITDFGVASAKFCKGLGIKNNVQIYAGCLEDMMMTKDKKLAEESAIAAEEFLAKAKTTPSKKFCVASGDPHFTNYDGAFFHLQEPGMYTIAKSADNSFEVQERMKKNGKNVPGIPSCITGAVVKYGSVIIEIDVANYGRVLINGESTELPLDFTLNVGGAAIRYGKQSVEWRGEKATASGLKITGRNGFNVFIEGGYCGVLEVNVPQEYFGRMEGICGNADGKRDANDFTDGYGKQMNVIYGTKNWEMTGYGGPTSPLSKWQLAWKALGTDCLFKADCEKGVSLRNTVVVVVPVATSSASVRKDSARASVSVSASKQRSSSAVTSSVSKQRSSSAVASSASKQRSSSAVASVKHSISRTISKGKKVISKHITSIRKHITDLLSGLVKEQTTELSNAKKNVNFSQTQADDIYNRYKRKVTFLDAAKKTIEKLDTSIQKHFKTIADDNAYLARLKLIKPKFLDTLNILNAHTDVARSSIEGTVVNGADKDTMLYILRSMNMHIKSMTANVTDAFMAHYRKYENQLNVDQLAYNDIVEQLRKAKIQLTDNTREEKEILAEYNRAVDVVQKLRTTATLTEEESRSLSGLERILNNVIQNGKTTQCFA